MLLKEYLTDINNTITDFAETGLIISSDVMTDILGSCTMYHFQCGAAPYSASFLGLLMAH